MFLTLWLVKALCSYHVLNFWTSEGLRSYKLCSYKKKRVYPNGAIVYIIRIQFMYFIGIIFRLDYISRGLNFASKILTKFAKLNPKN